MPNITDDIVRYLAGRLPEEAHLDAQTDLLSTGLLDSLLIMDLVAHLEATFSVRLGDDHLAPAWFRTPLAIGELVGRLREPCAAV